MAEARFLIDDWPHPQWQPLWHAGTRFDYLYRPALPYGTVVISIATGYGRPRRTTPTRPGFTA